jgi:hypothetical protein
MTANNKTDVSLRDAMYEFSLAARVPDAELLDAFVRRYPQYADALTEFAIELTADAMRDSDEEPDMSADPDAVSPAVARAMGEFQNRLSAVRKGRAAGSSARARDAASPVRNPFASLGREGFRALASRINVNTVLLAKLRDRQIDPATMPPEFCRRIAEEMDEPLEDLTAHLAAPVDASHARQFYKSKGKPAPQARQSFTEAVRGSGLSAEQRRRLLSFRD